MSVWGRRGSYSATAFVVVFFVVLAAVAHLLRPFIDKEANVDLAESPSDFMRIARFQPVEWKEWSAETIALARRRDRPILIYAGTVWGEMRPKFDDLADTPEVAELMNREFVCVRADSIMQPKWRSGPLQLLRNERGDAANFALFVFAPEGRLIAAPSIEELSEMSDSGFLVFLRRTLNQYADPNPTPLHEEAAKEAFQLSGGLASEPGSPTAYADRLLSYLDRDFGGFKSRTESELLPSEYEVLLDQGQVEAVAASITKLLKHPVNDALWGGFFERWQGNSEHSIVFAKTAYGNAGMLAVLTRLAVTTGSPLFEEEARRQFEYVLVRFADPKSSTYDFAKWKDAKRSPRHSFSPRRIRGLLNLEEQGLAVNDLGLDVAKNPQAIPFYTKRTEVASKYAAYQTVLEKLREAVAFPDEYQGNLVSYESQATAIASLCRSARLLNDDTLKAQCVEAFDLLKQRVRSGINDVIAWPGNQSTEPAGFSCYLQYASAAWEIMLLTEDEQYGEDGLAVLNRGIYLFTDNQGGITSGRQEALPAEWNRVFGPEVLDLLGASAVGELIRIGSCYSSWLGATEETNQVRSAVDVAVSRSGWVIDQVPIRAGAMARAIQFIEKGTQIGVPHGADWKELEARFPGYQQVPRYSLTEGYAIRKSGNWSKPLSLEELQQRL
ncbi:MAG: DUF255 domain-containing protein [Fimbriimonadaceae bacterium]|nr:MAG: DUF255 domain-containing protein [Fimbriimonadaceae bacterium]